MELPARTGAEVCPKLSIQYEKYGRDLSAVADLAVGAGTDGSFTDLSMRDSQCLVLNMPWEKILFHSALGRTHAMVASFLTPVVPVDRCVKA